MRSRLMLCLAAFLILALTTRAAPVTSVSLVGSWTLVSAEVKRADGGPSTSPFGAGTVGLLVYDPTGRVSFQVMRPGRPAFASSDRLQGTDAEVRAAFEGYLAYYGTYAVNEQASAVTHQIVASSYPNWIGSTQVRQLRLEGDLLTLSSASGRAGGSPIAASFVWKRLAGAYSVVPGSK